MPGSVVVIGTDLARYHAFTIALASLQLPLGTPRPVAELGVGVAENRNRAIRAARQRGEDEWIWFLDDDHTFAPDTLLRLLAHNRPIVGPLVTNRKPPFAPGVYVLQPDGQRYTHLGFQYLPPGGLLRVDAIGGAGMLVRKPVLDALADPWFEVGQLTPADLGEDLHFCRKATQAGFPVVMDLDTPMGHCTPVTLTARRRAGQWGLGVGLENGVELTACL